MQKDLKIDEDQKSAKRLTKKFNFYAGFKMCGTLSKHTYCIKMMQAQTQSRKKCEL